MSTKKTGIECLTYVEFSAQATNGDELNLMEQDQLEVIGEGEGDGWIRVNTKINNRSTHYFCSLEIVHTANCLTSG